MISVLQKLWRLPTYPWLAGLFPIFHLYAENVGLVIDSELLPSIALNLIGTSVVFFFFRRLTRHTHLAACLTGLCSLAFSLSGHIYVMAFMPRSLGIWTIGLLIGLGLLVSAALKVRRREIFAHATTSLNLIALVLLALQLFIVSAKIIELSGYVDALADAMKVPERSRAPKAMDSPSLPDIYYIIPDGYPSDSMLMSTENFDNSDFTNAMKARGFVVIGGAQSNYAITVSSLASVLNMGYLPTNASPYSNLDYLRLEASNSEVARLLMDKGYTYVQLLSGSLIPSPIADINRDFAPQSTIDIDVDMHTISRSLYTGALHTEHQNKLIERSYKHSFLNAYVDTTLLRLARSRLGRLLQDTRGLPFETVAPERFLATIDEVIKISAMPEATFTLAHLLKPHSPVTFNEQGEQIPWIHRPSREEFIAELKFVNSMYLHMIDAILAASEHAPIIIFQADHGSYRGLGAGDDLPVPFDIYAAHLLPQSVMEPPRPFTAVNTFRLLLNSAFGSEYELLEDRLFEQPRRYKDPFVQVDVTAGYLNRE